MTGKLVLWVGALALLAASATGCVNLVPLRLSSVSPEEVALANYEEKMRLKRHRDENARLGREFYAHLAYAEALAREMFERVPQ
jgi:hypothetical protein